MTEQGDDRPAPGEPSGRRTRDDGVASGDARGDDGEVWGRGAASGDEPTSDDAVDREAAGDRSPGDAGDRYVDVPLRLYKTVTVFSTLLAVVIILVGFVLLDRGTQRATAGPEEVSLPVVVAGLAFIVGGSAVYAFSTRFRAEGMGKDKDDTGERSNDG